MPEIKESDVAKILDKAAEIRASRKAKEVKEESIESSLPSGPININGIQVHEDGQITKTRYFEILQIDEDDYPDLKFTEEEAQKISNQMRFLSTGLNAAIPILCTGPSCPFAKSCPYQKIGKAPIGKPCILEKQLITYWTERYVAEFDVDMQNLTELHLVSELAEFDIYEMRITKYLAEEHPTLMQEVVTAVTEEGNIVSNMEISRAFDLKERIKRSRMKVLESLMATRKEKVKINAVSGNASTAQQLSDIKSKLDSFNKDIQGVKVRDEVIAEYTVEE